MEKILNKKLYVVSGSSGVGKGTVLKGFMAKHPDFMLSISCTTRKPRDGEKDGVNYFFLTKEEFLKSVDEDKFLEWAEFAGNCYGTKKKYIQECLNNGMNVILEIETNGALQVKKKMPEAVLIFIAPPSLEELEHRLRGRHTEDEATIQRRLGEVKKELECAKLYDHIVINDEVEKAISLLEEVIAGEQAKC
jgi:guanylate kinase